MEVSKNQVLGDGTPTTLNRYLNCFLSLLKKLWTVPLPVFGLHAKIKKQKIESELEALRPNEELLKGDISSTGACSVTGFIYLCII